MCAFVFASVFNALLVSDYVGIEQFFSMRIKLSNILVIIAVVIVWQFLFSALGIHRSRRLDSRKQEIFDILKLTTISTLILLGISVLFNIQIIDKLFLINFWVSASLLLILSRLLIRLALRSARLHGRNLRHMLIVGTGERALKFARLIHQKPELGYTIIGFADDQWEGIDDRIKMVSRLDGLPELVRHQTVDEVVIALPIKSHYDAITTIIKVCEEQGIIVRLLSDLFDLSFAKSLPGRLEDVPVFTFYSSPFDHPDLMVKRAIDIALSSLLLVVFSPLLLLVALLIKLDSRGPVFFVQDRVGYNKRRFKLLKFRSMIHDAEHSQDELEELNEATGPVFKIKADPRLTRMGKWLRRASIDELPQLINVIRGDMSLVGPRPLPVRDYNGFDVDWHRRRFSVRPGITCLWQINGRSALSFDKWMQLDMDYIDNWSLGLDLRILIKTIPAIMKGSGAV
jgi:exopolysaccharide biosynthesis polyprenyl glycosylphosphotransferase